MIEWLLTPISGAPDHAIAPWAAWHGRLMVLSWSFLLPIGMLAARYFKVTPGQDWPRALDNKIWWRTHLWVQSAGVAAMTLGLLIAFENASGAGRRGGDASPLRLDSGRYWLGAGRRRTAARPQRRTDRTHASWRSLRHDAAARRLRTGSQKPRMDRGPGRPGGNWPRARARRRATLDAARPCALVDDAARRGITLQRAGRCLDTYQAIWGPDPAHPGNKRKPIGWGVSRWSGS